MECEAAGTLRSRAEPRAQADAPSPDRRHHNPKRRDDLSLLDRMTPKAMRRYHNKGIFTVRQLSFVFKPRRRRRRRAAPPPHHDFEVQALAIRTGKVYIQTPPEIQRSEIELFLDIEGVPDQQF